GSEPSLASEADRDRERDNARCVLVLWTPRSANDDRIRRDAEHADARGNLVLAVFANVWLPPALRRHRAGDLSGWNGDPSHPGVAAVCDGVAATLGTPRVAPLPSSHRPPPRWLWLVAVAALALALLLHWWWPASEPAATGTGLMPPPPRSEAAVAAFTGSETLRTVERIGQAGLAALPFLLQRLAQRQIPLRVGAFPVGQQRLLRKAGQLARQRHRGLARLPRRHHAIGQAHAQRLGRVHAAAGEDEVHRVAHADQAR